MGRDSLFPCADLDAMEELCDFLLVADMGDDDLAPWAAALRRVVEMAHAANKALTDESAYSSALELQLARDLVGRMNPLFGPVDRDYACGAAYCDDPACNTHGRRRDDD